MAKQLISSWDTSPTKFTSLDFGTVKDNLASLFGGGGISTPVNNTMESLYNEIEDLLGSGSTQSPSSAVSAAKAAGAGAASTNISTITTEALPEITESTLATGEQIDAYLKDYTKGVLDEYAPGWQDMLGAATGAAVDVADFASDFMTQLYPQMATDLASLGSQATGLATTMLAGQVPGDVLTAMRQSSAEKAVSGLGTGGDLGVSSAARNLQARDLGLTSLNMMTQGQSMASTAAGLYGQQSTLASTASSLLGAPAAVALTGAQAIDELTPDSTADQWMSMISGLTGAIASTSLTDPSDLASLYSAMAQLNVEADWTKRLSLANALTGTTSSALGNSLGYSNFGGIS